MRFRLALGLAAVLAGCSGGGSKSSTPPVPPWGNFRQDNANSATAGSINNNTGQVSLISLPEGFGVTASTPTVDLDGNVLLGTTNGVVSFDSDDNLRWTFVGCSVPASPPPSPSPSPTPVSVGSVSASATVTGGNTIVFGSDANPYLFAIQEQGNAPPTCNWIVPFSGNSPPFATRSSAAMLVNPDSSLMAAFIGGDDGVLRALNADATVRWSFPTGGAPPSITSSPALDGSDNVYVASADGVLSSIDFAGRLLWRVPIGAPPGELLQPSPAVGTTVYAMGAGSALFAVNPNGTQKWQFPTGQPPPVPLVGSPAFVTQSINVGSQNLTDTIVYVIDENGTAYGVRDSNGTVFEPQVCLPSQSTQTCRTDSCLPNDGTCTNGKCSISGATCSADSCPSGDTCTVVPRQCSNQPAVGCTTDTCPPNAGTCEEGKCSMSGATCTSDSCAPDGVCVAQQGTFLAPPSTGTSLIVSGDLFVVVGTPDGRVCARGLDGSMPGQTLNPPTPAWSRYCSTTTLQPCVDDSDCPNGENGELCLGHCNVTTKQTCHKDMECPPDETCAPVQNGCIELGDGLQTLSSPSIGKNGVIYVTTQKGLYAIR